MSKRGPAAAGRLPALPMPNIQPSFFPWHQCLKPEFRRMLTLNEMIQLLPTKGHRTRAECKARLVEWSRWAGREYTIEEMEGSRFPPTLAGFIIGTWPHFWEHHKKQARSRGGHAGKKNLWRGQKKPLDTL